MASDFVAIKDHGPKGNDDPVLDTRERLVRAAIEVFLEKGYGGTRVQDIARRAGFTSGALYVHFPSRTALLGEAIIREGQSIMSRMAEQIGATPEGPDPSAARIAQFGSGETTNLDQLLLEALALAARSEEAREVLTTALDEFVGTLLGRIDDAKERGLIAPDLDSNALLQTYMAWIFGGISAKALGVTDASADDLTRVTARLISGLAPRD